MASKTIPAMQPAGGMKRPARKSAAGGNAPASRRAKLRPSDVVRGLSGEGPDAGADAAAEQPSALGSLPNFGNAPRAGHSALLTAFDRFASSVTRGAGSPLAFCLALLVVLGWAVSGPFFQYSENWQLVINTGTTIVTFLMVFLIQQSQNKDSVALHLKLDELLAANCDASNRMIGIEDLDEQDLREVAYFYTTLAERAKTRGTSKETHSIDDEGMPDATQPRANKS